MNFVLATSRPWNSVLAARLENKIGKRFYLLTRNEELNLERLAEIQPCYIFFPHWSYIIPEEIHKNYECIVFHMTDLPYGRGGSPLQNLILRGHRHTQISALRCTNELDAGPIYLKRPLDLKGSANDIFSRATKIIEDMIEEIIYSRPEPKPQQGDVVLFQRRKPEDSNLLNAKISCLDDFNDFIRMLDAEYYPKAFIELHKHRIEFLNVKFCDDKLVGTFFINFKKDL